MILKILIYYATTLFCLECSITVYRLNRRALANRLYAAAAFLYAVFSLAYVQLIVSPDATAARAWLMFYSPLFFLVVMLIIHFIMELTRYRNLSRSPYFLALLYGSGACVIAGMSCFVPVVKGLYKSPWGWTVLYDLASPWFWVAFNYSSVILLPGIAALMSWRRNTTTDKIRKQAGMILAAASTTAVLSLAQNALTLLLPAEVNVRVGDAYHQAVAIFFIGAMRFAIWKYKLMNVVPASTASEIFSGISNAVFLADGRGDVVFMNDRAREIVLGATVCCGKISLATLFRESESFQYSLGKILSGASAARSVTFSLLHGKKAVIVELFMHPLVNEIGACAGVLVIAREQTGLGELQKQAGLTDRELEVLLLLGGGHSAGEIADECEISLQTAKSHIHNIYHKTGLRNRVDLTNLLNKHS